ncbi:uncharacterized protein LOC111716968, partial [Eurytemora carolleeae]|uniref:uncharacterized protein LOC111716968 n=1 Tax=Eurytemora carolleeae TaxID=1294199 RepID=UPI000C76BC9C
MEDEDKVGVLIELGLEAPKTAKKERRSFYALPKTLSEDDDTFGVLNLPSHSRIDNSETESVVDTGVLVQFDNSQSSTESLEPSKHITLDSQFSSSKPNCSTQPFTSSHISLGQSLTSTSRFNENISKISHAATPSGFSLISDDDDVFSGEKSPINRTTNWDMIMNEAQFLAMSIKEEKPLKTPAHKVLVGGLLGDFSPCESLDSPLFDINKER